MQMRVDEARHGDQAGRIDDVFALIAAIGSDDGVAADGDVGLDQRSGNEIEEPRSPDDQVGRLVAMALSDPAGELLACDSGGIGHGGVPFWGHGASLHGPGCIVDLVACADRPR